MMYFQPSQVAEAALLDPRWHTASTRLTGRAFVRDNASNSLDAIGFKHVNFSHMSESSTMKAADTEKDQPEGFYISAAGSLALFTLAFLCVALTFVPSVANYAKVGALIGLIGGCLLAADASDRLVSHGPRS